MTIITFIIVISILVFVHEFGHFIVAKKSGIRVDEFSIGFPPRIWSKKKGETLYSLNLIPFGGYVKIFGENPDDESVQGPDKERSFVNKNRGIQAAVLVAGVTMNFLFAWLLLSLSFMVGVSQATGTAHEGTSVFVTDVVKDSPAERAGLKSGDVVQNIVDTQGVVHGSINSEELRSLVETSGGKAIQIAFGRGSIVATTSVVATREIIKDKFALGISMADIENVKYSFFTSLWEGAKSTWSVTILTAKGLLHFFGQALSLNADLKSVSGPVGIANYLNEAREFGIATLFSFVALISINLAVINLFPFPALDGGRLLVVAIEAIIRRPISPKITNTLNLVGFVLLMALMIIVTVGDIGRLF